MIVDAFTEVETNRPFTDFILNIPWPTTNSWDLTSFGLQPRDIGRGAPLVMEYRILEAPVSAGAATMQFGIVLSSEPTLIGGVGEALCFTRTYVSAEMPINSIFRLTVPPLPDHLVAGLNGLRYLGGLWQTGVSTFQAGRASARVVLDHGTRRHYVTGYKGP